MNKQEVIEKLQSEAVNIYNETSGWTKEIELDIAIDIIKQLDEPEKPVVPQFVADMIIERKKQKQGIITTIRNLSVFEEAFVWIRKNEEAFAKAWLYGYEVEKEKFYTARLKGIAKEKESYVYKIIESGEIYLSDLVFIEGKSQVYFTQTELENLKYWNNPAFEIEEVKK